MILQSKFGKPSFDFHKLSIRFYPEKDILMDAWIGAVIRNNFLFAAEGVLTPSGASLRQKLEEFPLPEGHPYYQQLVGGFPKGYLFDCSDMPGQKNKTRLYRNHIYTVHFVLIGVCSNYYPLIVTAFQRMFYRGFGHPPIPSHILDITEYLLGNVQGKRLYSEGCNFLESLSSPLRLTDFETGYVASVQEIDVELLFKTPVCLVKQRTKTNVNISYQDKMNGFPSFYQFMRSAAYRFMVLGMLYGDMEVETGNKQELEQEVEFYIGASTKALLLEANIQYHTLRGTSKKGGNSVYVMGGYQGRLIFGKVDAKYIPFLQFTSFGGNGNDINFGLGTFKCTLIESRINS